MNIIRHRAWFYIFSATLLVVSLLAIFVFGLNYGIDFKGGAIAEIDFLKERTSVETLRAEIAKAGFADARIQTTGERGILIRLRSINEHEHQQLLVAVAGSPNPFSVIQEKQFNSIGPTIGAELRRKAYVAIALVLVLILVFVSWAFRHVSKPVASWKYAICAIVALGHDVLIPTGVFAVLGRFAGAEVDALFVTAILTVLGFSVHDTIVVFDRIRENLRKTPNESFDAIVGRSLKETIGRSITTSFTVFIVVAALFWFGADVTRYFALTLLVGVVVGTYSSIFLASPLLVSWHQWSMRKRAIR